MSQEWKCKKLQIVYVKVAAMDKDIAATAAKDIHLVPDEIANDNAEHAVQKAQDASMYCCIEECYIRYVMIIWFSDFYY